MISFTGAFQGFSNIFNKCFVSGRLKEHNFAAKSTFQLVGMVGTDGLNIIQA